LQTVIVAEVLSQGMIEDLHRSVGLDVARAVLVSGASVGCRGDPAQPYTLASAYAAACPAPVGSLGERLGWDGVAVAVQRWGLTTPPSLPIPTEAADWSREAISSLRDEAIGQGALTVSPLHMALVAATLANEGRMPAPRLTLRPASVSGEARTVLAPGGARELVAAWSRCDGGTSTSGGTWGHWGVALAGEGEPHAWLLGVAPSRTQPEFAAAVLIEHAADPERVVDVGAALLQAAAER
jgi:peptidoglycan glycosyltransferase